MNDNTCYRVSLRVEGEVSTIISWYLTIIVDVSSFGSSSLKCTQLKSWGRWEQKVVIYASMIKTSKKKNHSAIIFFIPSHLSWIYLFIVIKLLTFYRTQKQIKPLCWTNNVDIVRMQESRTRGNKRLSIKDYYYGICVWEIKCGHKVYHLNNWKGLMLSIWVWSS